MAEHSWREASVRFHREFNGLGLNALAQVQIRNARMFTHAVNVFNCQPRNDPLSDRQ